MQDRGNKLTLDQFFKRLDVDTLDIFERSESLFGMGDFSHVEVRYHDRRLAQIHRQRARANMRLGQYDQAIADFGRSILAYIRSNIDADLLNMQTVEAEWATALGMLQAFLQNKLNHQNPDIPISYLIVASGGGVIGIHPFTDEGKEAAIAYADYVASHSDCRDHVYYLKLSESEDFDVEVHSYDGTVVSEVY